MWVEHDILKKQGEKPSGNDQHVLKPDIWSYGGGAVRRPPGLDQLVLVVQALAAGLGDNVTCRPNGTIIIIIT